MTARGLKFISILGLVFLLLSALHAEAQTAYRTYVSGRLGSDMNTCTLTQPCQTLRAAILQVRTGGEIYVLDGSEDVGLFGLPVTIDRSVSIINSGGRAGIDGELLVAPEAGGRVVLKGLDFLVISGVQVSTGLGLSLIIDDCTFSGASISFQPSGTATSNLVVRNSIVSAGSAGTGILIQPQSTGKTVAVIENVNVNNNSFGIRAFDYANVTVRNSVISENSASGIRVDSSVGPASVLVEHSQSSHNGNGVFAVGAAALARISDVTITDNVNGVYYLSGGTVCSFGNNSIAGNTVTLPATTCPLS